MKRCLGCMQKYDDSLEVCPYCGYVEGTMPEEAIHMLPGTVIHERYIIGKVVGYGGFGVTYIAWDTLLECRVAIKEYLPSEFSTRMPGKPELTVFNGDKSQQFDDGMKKFVEEAKRLAKFQNEPGIVKIYDCFEENRTAYIVMEYLEGITLGEYLKDVGTLPEDVAVQMMLPIMNSLMAVHKEGIIHRDIAPDNIMIASNGAIKLIDFGAARYATTSHSRSLTVIIKPGYSPEEQYRSRGDQGPHTDVYAVGAVLYRMITGQTPPDAMERRAYFESSRKDILEPMHRFSKEVSENRENAILNAMNVRIEDRSSDMGVLIDELTSDEPVARRNGKIRKIDVLRWPLWLKITVPAAMAAIATLVVLFVTGVIGFNIHSPREIYIPDGMTRVPRIVSMEEETARATLVEKKMDLVVSGVRYDEQIEEGCILTQQMSVGSVVPINYSLGVVMSAGAELAEVPYVVGFSKENAQEELEALGFTYETVETYDSVIPEGYISAQSVAGGTEQAKGTLVTLTVSVGRAPFVEYKFEGDIMPLIEGKHFDEAKSLCEKIGIQLIVSGYEYSDEYSSMYVLDQAIASGEPVQSNIVVEVTLSKGARIYKVPNVVYYAEKDAIDRLEAAEYTYKITYEESENVSAGCVISQSIVAGTEADVGTEIFLVVSLGPPKFDMINVVGKEAAEATDLLREMGLIVTVDYEYDENTKVGCVISQSEGEGEKVYRGYEITIVVCSDEELIPVPDVSDMTYEEAKSALEQLGFAVEKNEIYDTDISADRIITQIPAADSRQQPKSKILLTVSLGKQPVEVSFDSCGGKCDTSQKTVYYMETYGELPVPVRPYHNFLGWYTSNSAGTKIDSRTEVVNINNQTLYARWERVVVTVTYDANDGESMPTSAYVALGDNYVLPEVSRKYYSFDGWYTDKTGGDKITSDTMNTNSGSHTLYAHWTIKTVDVTYDAGKGSLNGDETVKYELGSNYEDKIPSRSGYSFVGWYTEPDGQGVKVLNTDIVTNEKKHTLYAYWSNDVVNVRFNSNGGEVVSSIVVVFDNEYGTLPATYRTGYNFKGWYTRSNGGSQIKADTVCSTTGSITLYAQWENAEYTVSFDAAGGSCSTASRTVTYDKSYGDLPTASRTGYTFDGWYTSVSGGTRISGSSVVSVTENQTLYAHWTANKYTVRFDANGGDSASSITVTYGETYGSLPITSRSGYTFDGWYTSASGGTMISGSSAVSITDNQTLYAHWTANEYTVRFDVNGGDSASPITVTYGKTYGSLPTTGRSGYTFDGWYTSANGWTKVNSSTEVSITEDQTLYAHWTANKYTVSFDANGGSSASQITVTYGETYGSLSTTSRSGYTFDGWYTSASGGTKINSGTEVSITANQTLYAHWTANKYTVRFDANGGNSASPITVTYGKTYGSLPGTSRSGYTFDGWYTSASSGTKINSSTKVSITANQTLYAHWTAKSVTSISISGSGNNSNSMQLSISYAPSDAVSGKGVTWKSSNNAVAKVDSNGRVTAVGEGSATITATSSNGKTATRKVTVGIKWGAEQSVVNSKPTESALLKITGTTTTAWHYHHYCSGDGCYSGAYAGRREHKLDLTYSLSAFPYSDPVDANACGGVGYAPACEWNYYVWWLVSTDTTYVYKVGQYIIY